MLLSTISFLSATASADIKFTPYGFAHLSYLRTSREFNADYKPIAVLSTDGKSAANMDLMESPRGQFTAKRSRFGFNAEHPSGVKAKFEFDLDGESGNQIGATPSNTGILRVRQANLMIPAGENGTITIGKKWDIFSPLMPHTAEVTMIQFYAGNTGFLTDGIDYVLKAGDATFAAELKNAGPDAATIRLSQPTATVRADYKMGDHLLGLSLLSGKLAYQKQDTTAPISDQDREITGTNVYYSGKFAETNEVIAEYYAGRNLGAGVTGSLAVAPKARAADDVKGDDSGFYISVKHKFETSAIYAGYGKATFGDETLANNDGDPTTANDNSYLGLVSNELSRVGYEHNFEGFTLFAEGAGVVSTYEESGAKKSYNGTYVDVGVIARF